MLLILAQKTELSLYFEGTNNYFLEKAKDINPTRFSGQQN